MVLVNTKGRIAFSGHPSSRDNIAADITTLLEGGVIDGDGCTKTKPKIDICQQPGGTLYFEGFNETSDDKLSLYHEEMKQFKDTGK